MQNTLFQMLASLAETGLKSPENILVDQMQILTEVTISARSVVS